MIELPRDHETLPVDPVQRLREIRDRFEAAWKAAGSAGSPPRIEDFLRDVTEADAPILIRELVLGDASYRRQRGSTPQPEDYLERFPSLDAAWLRAQLVAAPQVQQGCTELHERPTGDDVGASSSDPAPLSFEGRYLILGEIAQGGMGAILRGRDPDFNRELAIKVILPQRLEQQDESVQREMRERFIAEAKIAGQLQHPGVVPVYELGEFSGARHYFTMKLVKGRTLAALLDERPQPGHELPRFLKIFEQVCQTVAYAHSRRVIHRDLKPLNIMVGAFGEVQVMDWGLAKVMSKAGEGSDSPPQPAEGATDIRTDPTSGPGLASQHGWGTLEYMPPEQARGEVDRLDAPCDVFALGAILCKILTGQPPYVGRGAEVLRRQAIGADLDDAFARLEGCGAEPELIQLARHCLSARPEDRPLDAGAVASAVTAYLAGVQERLKEAEVARGAALVRAAEEVKRRRLTVALAATVLVVVIAGGGGWWWVQTIQNAHAAAEARRADDAQRNVLLALQEAAAFREQSHKLLEQPAQWQVALNDARSAIKRAEAHLSDVNDDSLRQQVLQRKSELDEDETDRLMVKRLEHIRLRSGVFRRFDFSGILDADSVFAKAFAEYGLDFAKLDTSEVVEQIERRLIRVELAEALGDWTSIRVLIGKDKDELTRRLNAVDARVSRIYYAWFGDILNAIEKKDAVNLSIVVKALVGDPRFPTLSAQRVNTLAGMCLSAGFGDRAEFLLRNYQQVRPNSFWANWNLAMHYRGFATVPNLAEAARFFHIAYALRPDDEEVRLALGDSLLQSKDYEKALAVLELASRANPNSADVQLYLGQAWLKVWEPERAAEHFRKALALKPEFPEVHAALGETRATQGRDEEAVAHYRQAIKQGDSYSGTVAARELRRFIQNTASTDAQKNKFVREKTEPVIARILEQAPGLGDCYLALGGTLIIQRKMDEAVAALRQAVTLKPNSGTAAQALSQAHIMKGEFEAAEREARRWLALGKTDPNEAASAAQYHEFTKLLLDLDKKLPAILEGREKRGDDPNRLVLLARVCDYRDYPVAAVRFYEKVLASNPLWQDSLGDDYCRALLRAAAGRCKDSRQLDDKERRMHYSQAIIWLLVRSAQRSQRMADALTRERASLATGGEKDRVTAQIRVSTEQELRRWKQDPDLALVRDEAVLAKLPSEAQKQLREFWSRIDSQLAMLTKGTIPPAPLPAAVQAVPGQVQPEITWRGMLDASLEKMKPETEIILEPGEFEKLWKAWRKGEKVPDIDFTRYFVVVVTNKESTITIGIITVINDGAADRITVSGNETESGRFGYELAVVPRAGIKTFRGKPLPSK
jgi:serine/threonine-protein kinase